MKPGQVIVLVIKATRKKTSKAQMSIAIMIHLSIITVKELFLRPWVKKSLANRVSILKSIKKWIIVSQKRTRTTFSS